MLYFHAQFNIEELTVTYALDFFLSCFPWSFSLLPFLPMNTEYQSASCAELQDTCWVQLLKFAQQGLEVGSTVS